MVLFFLLLMDRLPPRATRPDTPFPTRRSSDLHSTASEIFRLAAPKIEIGRSSIITLALASSAVRRWQYPHWKSEKTTRRSPLGLPQWIAPAAEIGRAHV